MGKHFTINVLQNLLFCIPKAAVLHGKSVGFTSQNSRFRNVKTKLSIFNVIIFTKPRLFFIYPFQQKQGIIPPINVDKSKTIVGRN
ncbi:hypothetical protein BWX40_08310 [Prevotella intermedia]|nr:hypothetical protein BWX40_08310 [Prevotella intermedia]